MTRIERFAFGIAAALTVTTAATFAQAATSAPSVTWVTIEAQDGPQGPPPHPGDFPGGRPPRDGRPGGPPRMPPPISATTIPVEEMTTYLKLTGTQVSNIKEIHTALREEMRPPRRPEQGGPPNGRDGGDGRPQPPSREEREARNQAMDAAIQKASVAVTALLDGEQKPRLVTLLKAFEALRAGRIPPPALRDLKLTESQWTQLGALGKNATREQIGAILTEAQRSVLESLRPGPGEHGGRGPGDGPPPPPFGNGPGGPPPGDF